LINNTKRLIKLLHQPHTHLQNGYVFVKDKFFNYLAASSTAAVSLAGEGEGWNVAMSSRCLVSQDGGGKLLMVGLK
jgi:hypothetical protein